MPDNDNITIVAREWMAKADNDLRSGTFLLKMKDCPTDTVCFHAQQCIEKSLKALLVACETGFRKTHDLGELILLLPPRFRSLLSDDEQDRFTEYATVTRYPGNYEPISLTEARQATKAARRVYREVKKMLQEKPLFQEETDG